MDVNFPKILNDAFINRAFDIVKWRRLKVGCSPKDCDLQEIDLLSSILCKTPCYLTEEDYNILENRLIEMTNV